MAQLWGSISVTQGGAAALLAIVVLLILFGRIVPLRMLESLRRDKDEQIQTWRAAYEGERAARLDLQAQNGVLLESARTMGHVLGALPQPARQEVTAGAPVDQAPAPPP